MTLGAIAAAVMPWRKRRVVEYAINTTGLDWKSMPGEPVLIGSQQNFPGLQELLASAAANAGIRGIDRITFQFWRNQDGQL